MSAAQHTPGLTPHDTARRAALLGLSFAQMKALDWMGSQHPPVFEREYRRAHITTKTMISLERKGFVTFGSDVGGAIWSVTYAGRAAIAKATGQEARPA